MVEPPVNFDKFRKDYNNLTFNEVEKFYQSLHSHFPNQEYMKHYHFKKMFDYIPADELVVVELGCNKGTRSKHLVNRLPKIKKWFGYDFKEFKGTSNGRYQFKVVDDWFYNIDIPDHDVFVCSHTIEHLSNWQAIKVLEHISKTANYIMIEVPLTRKRQDWKGRWNAHIMTFTIDELKFMIRGIGYSLFYYISNPNSKIMGWECDKLEMCNI